jgi:hypothetical protein
MREALTSNLWLSYVWAIKSFVANYTNLLKNGKMRIIQKTSSVKGRN